ncbi:MAG: M28 family peptidase [Myxococcales bacterium]|nr:M28 family peptidase [Myxococcales bacterium]
MSVDLTALRALAQTRWIPFIAAICEDFPRRVAGSRSEREAQERLRAEYDRLGFQTTLQPFEWNESLYAVLALHFGLAVAATAALLLGAPWLALLGHGLAALSYAADSHRRALVLRRWFDPVGSQNLIATRPAPSGPPRLRLVLVSHADAAFTGWLFHPTMIRMSTREPPVAALRFMRKGLLVATGSVALLAGLDLAAGFGLNPPVWLVGLLTVPAAAAFALNLQVVLRDEVVPGANDNLTGCVGCLHLAERLAPDLPDDVELVCVSTGAEEAGTGGAFRLAQQMATRWDRASTVVLGLDGLSNGRPFWFREGELRAERPPAWMEAACARAVETDLAFEGIGPFDLPVGATDSLPFLVAGYDALTVGTVDPEIGAPRGYHRPADTPEALDAGELALGLAFAEAVAREFIAERAPR